MLKLRRPSDSLAALPKNMIIGHQQIINFFDQIIEKGKLSHAYCFVGPESVGKRTVAEHLAAKIFNVLPEKLVSQLDFAVVEQTRDEKTGKLNQDVRIEQIRDLRVALARRSYRGGYKAAIIDRAEKMNAGAANALLKVLEEPKGKTVLFLLTVDESLLPQTIQSRCQMIYFHPVSKIDIQRYLDEQGVEKSEERARQALGLPGRARRWLAEPEEYERYQQEILRFISLLGRSFHDKIKIIEELFGDKSDAVAARAKLQSVLGLWLMLLRDVMYNNSALTDHMIHRAAIKSALDTSTALTVARVVEQARRLLNYNVHPRLLVEQVLLELP